ncbi:MAG: D-arabinono-1,4-lactone oxidase [Chloroflexota bacterium]
MNNRQLQQLVFLQATFPDPRIKRSSLLWAFCANFALASLLNMLSYPIGYGYIVLVTLWFLPVDVVTAVLGGSLLFGFTWLIQPSTPLLPTALLLVGYLCLTIIPHIWRDRIITGQFESEQRALYTAILPYLPLAFWAFLLLNLLEWGWRPSLKKQLKDLQRERYFLQENGRWHNWSYLAQSNPTHIYHPETLEDLQTIVKKANQQQKEIRMVGRSYSWPNWGTTDSILVNCRHLTKVEVDLSDPQQPRVIAEAGATNRQINDVLEKHGLVLPSNVVLEVVRIAGLVSTGSHGSGWHSPIVADYIHAIDIVTADGHCRHFEAGKDAPEIMDALRVSFGTFGLIWRLTLNVEPTWNVRRIDYHCSKEEMLQNIRDWVTSYDSVDLFYFPYCKKVWMLKQERLAEANVANSKTAVSLRHSTWDLVKSSIQMEIMGLFQILIRRFPRLTPPIGRLFFTFVPRGSRIVPIADCVHHQRSVDSVRLGNIEIAFKLEGDFSSFFQAWHSFETITAAYAEQGKYPFNMAFNVRFIGSSTALLSPAHGAGHTCYIEILSSANTPHWEAYSAELAEAWLQLPQAAPHWPKQWEHIPNIDHYLRQRYSDNLRQFNQIREELNVDPNNIFLNKLTRRILGLVESGEV